ncbi:hypothetical protein JHK82_031796 [Glycine max]|uniref:Endonuclease/exonuclease/phosphatase domain-containing protein n=1 Tax=Glycine max TaxID=3847 RepID=A0A0R0HVF2_SOYBN|nr:hypothetical protein JHK87_031729 [Glycine soja]KAG4989472.1 hypothetical protein JHK85_032455 [Glycine max]KAG4995061.1 hypothetical protein JHK86_031888 [Glycine max]KAG5125059.1 hypothetical protein JHK82_031796 [Glycine max]KAG5146485.1 hypothetical protein JHK84_032028 [Glycine max]
MGKFWGDLVVEEESDTGKEDQDALAFGAQFQRVISKSKKRSWSKGRRKLTPKGSTIPAVGMILYPSLVDMKILFWNIRGLANPKTKIVLKNLCLSNKPDFLFVSEPWSTIE